MIPALIVLKNAIRSDPALQQGGRGARKIVVTKLWGSEKPAQEPEWRVAGEFTAPVLVSGDFEFAVFNQTANQDRHHHSEATEIYTVLEGEMVLEVETQTHRLQAGESAVVIPKVRHCVLNSGREFICQVITLFCGRGADKIVND